MSPRPLADATLAATLLTPQIVGECVLAEHAGDDRDSKIRRLGKAIEICKELTTRLECSRDIFAATPAAEPMFAVSEALRCDDEAAP